MLNCRQVNLIASDYLDRGLGVRQHLLVRAHLAICRHCRRFLRQLRLARDTLRRLPPKVDEATVQRLRDLLLRLPPAPAPQRPP